jgi:hypothetical protein
MISTTVVRHVAPTTPLLGGLRADGTSFGYHRALKCYTIHCDITGREEKRREEKRREEKRREEKRREEKRREEKNDEWSK